MAKITLTKGAACTVDTDNGSFVVFPEKAPSSGRAILSNPLEDFSKELICWPGEYDFNGMFLRGIGQEEGKQVSYVANFEGMRVAFINAPVMKWTDIDLEKLGDVDVLILAAEDEKKMQELVENVDPRMIILFATDKGSMATAIKACGVASAETMSTIKVTHGSLPSDSRSVVVLGE